MENLYLPVLTDVVAKEARDSSAGKFLNEGQPSTTEEIDTMESTEIISPTTSAVVRKEDTPPECAENTAQCSAIFGSGCCQIEPTCSHESCSVVRKHESDLVSILSEHHVISVTPETTTASSTESLTTMTAKMAEKARSVGPSGLRCRFGCSSAPVLEEISIVIAVTIAWTAAWHWLYL